MEKLLGSLEKYMVLSSSLKKGISERISFLKVKRRKPLAESGKVCESLFYIQSGLIRGYYYHKRKDITNWFSVENEFATSMYSFVSGKPNMENIETLEDSELLVIKRKDLNFLYENFSEMNLLGRILMEKYYLELGERAVSLQFQTAKERYGAFLQKRPDLFDRVKLGQIASYLGITIETLSRIRSVS